MIVNKIDFEPYLAQKLNEQNKRIIINKINHLEQQAKTSASTKIKKSTNEAESDATEKELPPIYFLFKKFNDAEKTNNTNFDYSLFRYTNSFMTFDSIRSDIPWDLVKMIFIKDKDMYYIVFDQNRKLDSIMFNESKMYASCWKEIKSIFSNQVFDALPISKEINHNFVSSDSNNHNQFVDELNTLKSYFGNDRHRKISKLFDEYEDKVDLKIAFSLFFSSLKLSINLNESKMPYIKSLILAEDIIDILEEKGSLNSLSELQKLINNYLTKSKLNTLPGKYKQPTLDEVIVLSDDLDITVNWLFQYFLDSFGTCSDQKKEKIERTFDLLKIVFENTRRQIDSFKEKEENVLKWILNKQSSTDTFTQSKEDEDSGFNEIVSESEERENQVTNNQKSLSDLSSQKLEHFTFIKYNTLDFLKIFQSNIDQNISKTLLLLKKLLDCKTILKLCCYFNYTFKMDMNEFIEEQKREITKEINTFIDQLIKIMILIENHQKNASKKNQINLQFIPEENKFVYLDYDEEKFFKKYLYHLNNYLVNLNLFDCQLSNWTFSSKVSKMRQILNKSNTQNEESLGNGILKEITEKIRKYSEQYNEITKNIEDSTVLLITEPLNYIEELLGDLCGAELTPNLISPKLLNSLDHSFQKIHKISNYTAKIDELIEKFKSRNVSLSIKPVVKEIYCMIRDIISQNRSESQSKILTFL